MPKGLDPNQDQHYVGPGLGSNCLQRLSTDDKESVFSPDRQLEDFILGIHYLKEITLEAPTENASENIKYKGKQCGPRSDCS